MSPLTLDEIAAMLVRIRHVAAEGDAKRTARLMHLLYVGLAYHVSQFGPPEVATLAKKVLEVERIKES
jgi:hypothetical protein